ncbi:MAG: hypothetical protein VB050_04270 [Geobacteraceae bacterium]|nr:hypothetical protein [Geobacteraceae bacterium]
MADEQLLDDLDEVIAKVAFMNCAIVAITDKPRISLAEEEVLGMQKFFFNIESGLVNIKTGVDSLLTKSRQAEKSMANFGKMPRTLGEIYGQPKDCAAVR